MPNEYNPQAYAAVLIANGYGTDKYWLDVDGGIYAIDNDMLVNNGSQNIVMWQLAVAKLIEVDKLKTYNQVAIALSPVHPSDG